MPRFTQENRMMAVTTPLGPDMLLLNGFSGTEQLSRLFSFDLDLLAEAETDVPFEKLLGKPVSVKLTLRESEVRYFHGIVSRFSQGERVRSSSQGVTFVEYRAEIVPQFWLLTRMRRSRIFQHESVPDILKKVLQGLDVQWELQGTFQPRDYCTQYRESDFDFASRLMEEEGIYYYFTFTEGGHRMVVANTPANHKDVPVATSIEYDRGAGGIRDAGFISRWSKTQELRSAKYTLWDHTFELPHKHLEAERTTIDSVAIGTVQHKLKLSENEKLELYDYPGAYAQRFDGIDKGGQGRPKELDKIYEDNARTVSIRMQEEAAFALSIQGSSDACQLTAGHKFELKNHFNADGGYVLTEVRHSGRMGATYTSPERTRGGGEYENAFVCIPAALPFRPERRTKKAMVEGTQTAVVVGPSGEEIFTDKYSRVKVQFHWDREGQFDASSSCWIRVGTTYAGRNRGWIHVPRIGEEVIVDYLEGDPDQPIIIGSVYNAENMPPYLLPDHKTRTGLKTRSTLKGGVENFNELRFEDKKGEEQIYIHAEKNQDIVVENDETHFVGHDRTKEIGNDERTDVKRDRTETVGRDERITIGNDRTEQVEVNESITIGRDRTESVGQNESITIGATRTTSVGRNETLTVQSDREQKIGRNEKVDIGSERSQAIGKNDQLEVGKSLVINAGSDITLKTGQASIIMKKDGTIQIKGKNITIIGAGKIGVKASKDVNIKGSKVTNN